MKKKKTVQIRLVEVPEELHRALRIAAATELDDLTLKHQTPAFLIMKILMVWARLMEAGQWEVDDGVNTAVYDDLLAGMSDCLFHAPDREWKIKRKVEEK